MKIELFDSKGQQIMPISLEKAKKLTDQERVKPISKNPPRMKMLEDSFSTKVSRKMFLITKKHGVKIIPIVCAVAVALALAGIVLGNVISNQHDKTAENLVKPTAGVVTETTTRETTTKPTEEETTVEEETITTQRATYQSVAQQTTTKKQTTTRRTKKTTQETKRVKKTTEVQIVDNGLPVLDGVGTDPSEDELPEVDSGGSEGDLPVL